MKKSDLSHALYRDSNIASEKICSAGGVGRNLAEALARLSFKSGISFASVVGSDSDGASLTRSLEHVGVNVSRVISVSSHPTASYCSFLSKG